ncbi:MAG: isochorismate synthase, partial [Planctomycetota bacterium]
AFDGRRSGGLPGAWFFLPALQARVEPDGGLRITATLRVRPDESAPALARRWRAAFETPAPTAPPRWPLCLAVRDSSAAAFRAAVRRALAGIAHRDLDKVVCSRTRTFTFERAVPPALLLQAVEVASAGAVVTAIGRPGEAVWVGASPERLVRRTGNRIETMALAGTDAPGAERALLASDKARREHELVAAAIERALAPVARACRRRSGPEVVALPGLRHLRTEIEARAHGRPHVLEIAARLHPTPAVCGQPREAAWRWLAGERAEERGWYTGAVGTVQPGGDGELFVLLRCLVARGRRLRLHAGAGIVAGSCPEAEWRETERKLAALARALEIGARQEVAT